MGRSDLIQFRRGTAAEWIAANPVLALGEPGYETDTGTTRIGDGVTAWSGLAASGSGGGAYSWASNGTSGLTKVEISNPTDSTLATSVVAGRLRVTGTGTGMNHRAMWLIPGTSGLSDCEVQATIYAPSVLDPATATPQPGIALRGSSTRLINVDQNIAAYNYGSWYAGVWGTDGTTLTQGTQNSVAVQDSRMPNILGVQRLAGTPGTNIVCVDELHGVATGDQVTVALASDSTYNGDFTVSSTFSTTSIFYNVPTTAIVMSDAAHTTASPLAFSLGTVQYKAPAVNASNPKAFYPWRVAARAVGTNLWVKQWYIDRPEPDWGAPMDLSASSPSCPTSGSVGVITNHLRNGAYVEFGDIEIRSL